MPSNGTTQNGTDDETELSRRGMLRSLAAAGGAGLTAGLAGCGDFAAGATSQTYEADPVAMGEAGMELGHRLADHGSWEVTRSADGTPLDAEVTLINRFAVYSREQSHLGLVAMPAVEENGESINPLVDRPLAEVVPSDLARSLLQELGLPQYADVDWQAGPAVEGGVEFLGSQPEMAAFLNGEGSDQKRLRIARIEHEGDVVFGVGAATPSSDASATPTPDDEPEDHGGNTSPLAWWNNWRNRWKLGLGHGRRTVPQCYSSSSLPSVEIDQPGDGASVDTEGNTSENMQVRPGQTHGAIEFDAKALSTGYCIDHLEWSYRLDPQSHSGTACGYDTSWTSLGTGSQQTFGWTHCFVGTLSFEIRVEAVDANGTVLFSDTHEIDFVANS